MMRLLPECLKLFMRSDKELNNFGWIEMIKKKAVLVWVVFAFLLIVIFASLNYEKCRQEQELGIYGPMENSTEITTEKMTETQSAAPVGVIPEILPEQLGTEYISEQKKWQDSFKEQETDTTTEQRKKPVTAKSREESRIIEQADTETISTQKNTDDRIEQKDANHKEKKQLAAEEQFDDAPPGAELHHSDTIYPEKAHDHENELPLDLFDVAP